MNLAKTCFNLGLYAEMAKNMKALIDQSPEVMDAYYYSGVALLRMGNIKQAQDMADKAIALEPEYPYAYHLKALIYEKLGDAEKANEFKEKALELDPNLQVL
jgi:tetratricopeptide (TPR) repeat protein